MQSQASQNEQPTSLHEFTWARHFVTHAGDGRAHSPSKVGPPRVGQRAATRAFAPAQVAIACGAQARNRPPPQTHAADGLHCGKGHQQASAIAAQPLAAKQPHSSRPVQEAGDVSPLASLATAASEVGAQTGQVQGSGFGRYPPGQASAGHAIGGHPGGVSGPLESFVTPASGDGPQV
jgi:hypothetical protein